MVGGGRSLTTRLRWRVGAQSSSYGSGAMRMVGRPVWGGAGAASAAAATAKVVGTWSACGRGGFARWMSTEGTDKPMSRQARKRRRRKLRKEKGERKRALKGTTESEASSKQEKKSSQKKGKSKTVTEWLPQNMGLQDNLKAPGNTSDMLASARDILKDIIVSHKDIETAVQGAQQGWIYKFLVAARRSEKESKESEGWVEKFQVAVRQAELKRAAMEKSGDPKQSVETIAIQNAQAMLKEEDFEAAENSTVEKPTLLAVNGPADEVLAQEEGKAGFPAATPEELFRQVHAPRFFAEASGDSIFEPERQARPARGNQTMEESKPRAVNRLVSSVLAQEEGNVGYSAATSEEPSRKVHAPRFFAEASGDSIFEPERQARPARGNQTMEESKPRAVNRLVSSVLAQEEGNVGYSVATSEEPSREVRAPRFFAETVGDSTYEPERQARPARRTKPVEESRPRAVNRMVDTVFAQKDGKRRYSAPKSEEALWKAHVPRVFAKETGDSTYEPEQQARPARRNKTVEESTPRAGNRPVGNVLAQEKGKVGFSAATSDEPFQEVHEPRVFAETVGYSTYERERQARSARRNESMHSRSRPPRSSLPRWPTPRERQPISLQDDSGAHALRIYDDISDRGEIDTGELGAEYSKLGEDAILEAAVVVQASPAKEMKIVPAPGDDVTVPPTLAHGLDRVLFSPGVHMLQDPRTGVYNFPADLKNIMSVHDFDFDALPQYQPPSGDSVLEKVAVKYKRRYYGSTSNMTVILSQFHFFLSRARPLHVPQLSKAFQVQPEFTKGSLSAASFFLRYKPKTGTYALDVDKSEDEDMILMWLGRSMEKQLVTNSTEYSLFHRENSHQLTPEMRADRETYHYTAFGEFMMRSQQDAMDARLPGEGTFDLKTRAVEAVRYDIDYINERATCDYQLRTLKGERESFEREYYDMARSAFLKYLLQVRMGRMDGIMVAYHNVKRLFGFQYIPREEMDAIIHGPSYRNIALPEFQVSIEMMGDLFGRATEKFPETSLHCLMHYEERDQELHVFVTPMSEEEIAKTQKREESRMFNVKKKAQKIAEAILNSDETGAKARKTTEGKKCAEDQFNSTLDDDINYTIPELKDKRGNQVFVHYRIEINHIINGERLPPYTPPVIKDDDDWKIEYLISEIPEHGDRESVIEFSRAMQTRKLGRAGSHSSMLRSLGEAGARYQDLLDARDHEKNFETYAPERGEVLYQERIEKMREEMRKRMESGEEPTLEQLKGYKEVNGFWEKPSPKEKPWSKE